MATTKKTILITGATTGIGRHAAVYLASRGHRVIATGRSETALEKLRLESGVETLRLDVTDGDSIARAAAEVDRLTEGRGLDALVNNAGYGQAGPVEELEDADLRAQFETNVFGLVAVTQAFLPKMRRRGVGRIVNVSSIGGRTSFPFFGAYHASKYAVEALSDALRNEVAPFGVKVSIIEPGPIRSEFATRAVSALRKYVGDAASPYAHVYARAQKIVELSEATAKGPECVSYAIERAITARWPRARYVVPFRSRIAIALATTLPTPVLDGLYRLGIALLARMSPASHAAPAKVGAPLPMAAAGQPALVESSVG